MRNVLFCILVIVILTGEAADQKVPLFSFKTIGLNCYPNLDFVVNVTCKLKPINWEKTVALMEADLIGVARNVTLHMQLFKWTSTNLFRPFVINVTTNACNMMGTGSGNPYAKVVVKLLKPFTNINHSCPYEGHLLVKGFYIDSSVLSFGLPIGKYKINLLFYEGWPMAYMGVVEFIFASENVGRPRNNPGNHTRRNKLSRSTAVEKSQSKIRIFKPT